MFCLYCKEKKYVGHFWTNKVYLLQLVEPVYLVHKQNCFTFEHLLFILSYFHNFFDIIYATGSCWKLHKPSFITASRRVGYNVSQGGLKIQKK